jgi:P-type E1-E2 ATPase
MAGVDILCSDKTGTITKNKLSVAQVEAFDPYTGCHSYIKRRR